MEYPLSFMHFPPELLADARSCRTLEQAFRWAIRQEPPLTPGDVVIQDEYTHDVLFRSQGGYYLVFDTT
jgi:hypothetical protein